MPSNKAIDNYLVWVREQGERAIAERLAAQRAQVTKAHHARDVAVKNAIRAADRIDQLEVERRTAIDLWKEATTKLADAGPADIGMVHHHIDDPSGTQLWREATRR